MADALFSIEALGLIFWAHTPFVLDMNPCQLAAGFLCGLLQQ